MDFQNLVIKLNFKTGKDVVLCNVPAEIVLEMKKGGLTIVEPGFDKAYGALYFIQESAGIEKLLPELLVLLNSGTVLWIAYPKGGSGVKTDLNRDKLWKLMQPKGFRPVRQVAIDGVWSAMRFKYGEGPLPAATSSKAVREIVIPEDLLQVISKTDGLLDFFNSLAFTHRKEYVQWIESAKKNEIRKNRIEETIRLLFAKKKLSR
jgi:hypothetical protein